MSEYEAISVFETDYCSMGLQLELKISPDEKKLEERRLRSIAESCMKSMGIYGQLEISDGRAVVIGAMSGVEIPICSMTGNYVQIDPCIEQYSYNI